jgi:hypothetical protein
VTSGLTSCCEIQLGYSLLIPDPPCNVGPLTTYYISAPCKATICNLKGAFAIYTDDSCTIPAPDGYYSDGNEYCLQSGGHITSRGLC